MDAGGQWRIQKTGKEVDVSGGGGSTPKTLAITRRRMVRSKEGVHLPSRLLDRGSVVSSTEGSGAKPWPKTHLVHFEHHTLFLLEGNTRSCNDYRRSDILLNTLFRPIKLLLKLPEPAGRFGIMFFQGVDVRTLIMCPLDPRLLADNVAAAAVATTAAAASASCTADKLRQTAADGVNRPRTDCFCDHSR